MDTPFKFVRLTEGAASDPSRYKVTVAAIPGGVQEILGYPGQDQKGKTNETDADTVALLKGLKPGDIINIKGRTINGSNVLNSAGKYEVQPGEDEPYAFVFRRKVEDKTTSNPTVSIEVCKMGQVMTLQLPQVQTAPGKTSPDPKLLAQVSKFKKGDMVLLDGKQVGQTLFVSEISPYMPLQKGQFVHMFKKGERKDQADGKDFAYAEIQTAKGAELFRLAADKAPNGQWVIDQDVVNALSGAKAKDAIEFRIMQNADGQWLTFARPAAPAKDAAPAPKAS